MRLKRDFGQCANAVLRDPTISVQAKGLYALMTGYANQDGEVYAKNKTLADAMGASTRTIQKWLGELIEHGVVVRERRFFGGKEGSTLTRLVEGEVSFRGEPQFIGGCPTVHPGDEACFTPWGEAGFIQNKTTKNKTTKNKTTLLPRKKNEVSTGTPTFSPENVVSGGPRRKSIRSGGTTQASQRMNEAFGRHRPKQPR